jgi:DNA-directed RNA polymerase specialized sigma24 family protein
VKDNGGTDQKDASRCREEESILELLTASRMQLERLFLTFRIPPSLAETMLEEAVMVLLYRRPEPAQPTRWLLRTLRRRCVRHWRGQQREEWLQVELQLHDWLEAEGCSQIERTHRRRQLAALINRLPPRCRGLIRQRFQPPLPATPARAVPSSPFLHRELEDRCMAAMLRLLLEAKDFTRRS